MAETNSSKTDFFSPILGRLAPYPYQRDVWERSRALITYALFMEQGTGKTKVTIDTITWLYQQRLADLMIVVAPSGVHTQWVMDELPKHMPEQLRWTSFAWNNSAKVATDNMLRALVLDKRLVVLAFNIESVNTPRARKWIQYFLQHRDGMLVVDEATDIKRPSAKRTRALWYLGKFAKYRRILTGTPASEGPFGYYSMFRFLHWQILGYQTYAEFKADFAEWEQLRGWREDVKVDTQGRPIMVVARDKAGNPRYKNLDRLQALAEKRSYRITKAEALPWLPPKGFQRRLFDLSLEQRRIYNDLRHDYLAEFAGKTYYADVAIVRMLRLQQVACGYLPSDDEEPHQLVPGGNPRIEALQNIIDETSGQCIIWARFAVDIDQIMKLLGKRAVRYDAAIKDQQRERNKQAFLSGDAQFFVGNCKAGGRGLNIQVASTMVFYSNYFDLEWRQQGEDRGHRAGMVGALTIYDLCGRSTVDEYVIKRLVAKQRIADTITGDSPQEWIGGS